MRKETFLQRIAAIFIGMLSVCSMACAQTVSSEKFVVLELFTSEGCASCPPADLLMEKTIHENKDKAVYVLCFHVDYFNRQGWADPFSKATYSHRQERYDKRFRHYVFTPQLVINGSHQTSGYDAYMVNKYLRKLPESGHNSSIHARAVAGKESVKVTYRINDPDASQWLEVALVQRSGDSRVTAGENTGKHLHHANIVRAFIKTTAGPEGSLNLPTPPGVAHENLEVILLRQDPVSLVIKDAFSCGLTL